MDQTFLTALDIHKVRHLCNINIPLSSENRKNLVLTGKNGSGKTSVLDSLAKHLNYIISGDYRREEEVRASLVRKQNELRRIDDSEEKRRTKEQTEQFVQSLQRQLAKWTEGCVAEYTSVAQLREKYQHGQFVLAYYGDRRKVDVASYTNIEKVELKSIYELTDRPSRELGKYLVNLKSIQAFAQTKGDMERANQIEAWFQRFEGILRDIYHDETLELDFDIETFQFAILTAGKEPFSFNTMSMGYAAIFDIISDLIMRMESQKRYDLEGIVLIDEIETHLHVELQKEIVPFLTKLFPNIQFILTTHSPFVLNSATNAVVYDLEEKMLVEDGLANLPYEGIVEGYFNADLLSQKLRSRFEAYKKLVGTTELTDTDYARIAELEYYLDEVPDYLAVDFSEEYTRLKTEFSSRG